MTKISKKIIKDYRKHQLDKIINFSEVIQAKEKLDAINSSLENRFKIDNFDPSFEVYILMQNLISFFSEEVSILDEFTEYYDRIVEIDEEYMPSYPPNSPISGAYFTYWCFFDFRFGAEKETIGSVFYDLGIEYKFDELALKAVNILNNSSMRFYKHMGIEGELIKLKDLLSGEIIYCISPSKYLGKKSEIWFARLAPNLDKIYNYQIVLTTPYIITDSSERDWVDFFNRQGINNNKEGFEASYQEFTNSNSRIKYWHNYIMEAYSNYESNCIFLSGIPDIKGSKPHELF
jgi:hypothetical protein